MLAPWPSLAQACLAAGKASPSPAFGKLICTLQGPSPRSPPLGSLPKDLRPCLGLLSTPAGLMGGRGLPVQLRVVLCWGLWVRCVLLFFPSGHCWLPTTPWALPMCTVDPEGCFWYHFYLAGQDSKAQQVLAASPDPTVSHSVSLCSSLHHHSPFIESQLSPWGLH